MPTSQLKELYLAAKEILRVVFAADSALEAPIRERYLQHKWRHNLYLVIIVQLMVFVLQILNYRRVQLLGPSIQDHPTSQWLIILGSASLIGFLAGVYAIVYKASLFFKRLIVYGYLGVLGVCMLMFTWIDLVVYESFTNLFLYCGIIAVMILFNWKELFFFYVPIVSGVLWMVSSGLVSGISGTRGVESSVQLIFWAVFALGIVSQKLSYSDLKAFIELERRQEANEQLMVLNQQLERISETDPLTQLLNRRALDKHADQLWNHCLRHNEYITVMILDIDYFKPYNDNFGHPQGDLCLQRVAAVLRGELRRSFDILARYGGEEFAVVLGFLSPQQARAQAEKLRFRVEQEKMETAQKTVSPYVTVSIGLITVRLSEEYPMLKLYQLADDCLYDAKEGGRNKVAFWEDGASRLL